MSVVKELVNLLELLGDNGSLRFSIGKTTRSLCIITVYEVGSDRHMMEHHIALRVTSFQDPKPDVRLTEVLQEISYSQRKQS